MSAFAQALRACRLPAWPLSGRATEAALRRLVTAWEAATGAPPCNLTAVWEHGNPEPVAGDWPEQSLEATLAAFCAERGLPLEITGDTAYIGYGLVPSDRNLLLLSCPPERLPLLPSGERAETAPAIIVHLRRLIHATGLDFGPGDRAWYLPDIACIQARGRRDFRLRLAAAIEDLLLPPPAAAAP